MHGISIAYKQRMLKHFSNTWLPMTSMHVGFTLYLVTGIQCTRIITKRTMNSQLHHSFLEQLVSIPVHHGLTDVELKRIVEAINGY